jgi:hypothetical protein
LFVGPFCLFLLYAHCALSFVCLSARVLLIS